MRNQTAHMVAEAFRLDFAEPAARSPFPQMTRAADSCNVLIKPMYSQEGENEGAKSIFWVLGRVHEALNYSVTDPLL